MAEVAGLVLGGFPLLISALEHYQDCFQALGYWARFRAEWRKFYDRISAASFEFDLVLEELFPDALGKYDFLLPSKNKEEQETRWQEVETKLRSRLRKDVYRTYAGTMRDMADTMAELKEAFPWDNLSMSPNDRTSQTDLPAKSFVQRTRDRALYELLRTKFSFWSQQRERLLEDLDRQIATLDRLLRKSDEALRRPRMAGTSSNVGPRNGYLTFWRHARDILELINRCLCCGCRSSHCTELLLLDRLAGNAKCDLIFRFDPSSTGSRPWDCHRVIVDEAEAVKPAVIIHDNKASVAQVGAAANPSKPKSSFMSVLRKPRAPRADIAAQSPSVSFPVNSGGGSCTTTVTQVGSHAAKAPQTRSISDLCKEISRHESSNPCSGTLSSIDIGTVYAMASQVSQPTNDDLKSVNLQSLLSNERNTPKRAARYAIAYMLASSQLQLHSSSWLESRWDNKDISFVLQNGCPVWEEPYLRKSFKAPTGPQVTTVPSDDTFVTLGVLLLELFWGKTLEDSPYRQQYRSPTGKPDMLMDLAAAQRWADDVEDFAGPEISEAIRWCLARWKVRVKDDSWRMELEQLVVEPFRAAHKILAGKVSMSSFSRA